MDIRYEIDDLSVLRYEVNRVRTDAGLIVTFFRRVYQLSGSPGSPMLTNLALAFPEDFYLSGQYIARKMPGDIAEFYLVGTVTLSALSTGKPKTNRQICCRLMWETAPRAFSFIGIVMDRGPFYVPSFQSGVSFSTMAYRGELLLCVRCDYCSHISYRAYRKLRQRGR